MKNLLHFLLLVLSANLSAQYCGNSGPQVCTPQYYLPDTGGLYNISFDSIPCIISTVPYSEVMTIRCDSLIAGGGTVHPYVSFDSIFIDSIIGLPEGICWSTNHTENGTSDWMCLYFSGITYSPSGTYSAHVFHKGFIPGIPGVSLTNRPFNIIVRDAGDPCVLAASDLKTQYIP